MSIKTWIKEFYPIPVTKVSKKHALKHSLKKWEGLLKKNLKKHQVYMVHIQGFQLIDNKNKNPSDFSKDDTCALCWHFYQYVNCGCCPIAKHSINCNFINSAYQKSVTSQDARPMVELLRKLVKLEEGE